MSMYVRVSEELILDKETYKLVHLIKCGTKWSEIVLIAKDNSRTTLPKLRNKDAKALFDKIDKALAEDTMSNSNKADNLQEGYHEKTVTALFAPKAGGGQQ